MCAKLILSIQNDVRVGTNKRLTIFSAFELSLTKSLFGKNVILPRDALLIDVTICAELLYYLYIHGDNRVQTNIILSKFDF